MATYSSRRLIMGKVEICNFFLSQWRYLIGCREGGGGGQKGSIFVKMFKNLLLRNHMEDKAETWHTCLGYYLLQKLFFYFDRIRTLVAMAA